MGVRQHPQRVDHVAEERRVERVARARAVGVEVGKGTPVPVAKWDPLGSGLVRWRATGVVALLVGFLLI